MLWESFMILDGSTVNIGIAFIAGLVSFFAPCVVPLVPAYVGFFSGVAATDENIGSKRKTILKYSLVFSAGFVLIFVVLGLAATSLGHLFAVNRTLLSKIGGVVMILLGLYLTGVFKNPAIYKELKIDIHKKISKYQSVNSFVLGLTFGFAWTPCIGPVLAVILLWASQATSTVVGMSLLLAYGMGLAVPFMVIGFFIDKMLPWIKRTAKIQKWVHVGAGVFIIIFGVLLITESVGALSSWFLQFDALETYLIG
jgi:cytochrome c-type biogenesis protein